MGPFIYFHLVASASNSFSSATGKPFANFLSNSIGAVSQFLLVLLFAYHLDMKFDGILLATGLQFLVRFIVATTYLNTCVPVFKEEKTVTLF